MMTEINTYTDDFLATKRQLGDTSADFFISKVFEDAASKQQLNSWMKEIHSNENLLLFKDRYPDLAPVAQANLLPNWASARLMKTGAAFFVKHSESIMSLLGLLSLPYCYTAANGAMVLYLSDRMRNDVAKRLYETASFVWEVMAPNAFTKQGNGFAAILKVRLMHAAVRYYTVKSGKWNEDWGLPVNQEDMAGTNLSFSLIVIRGLRKLGYSINQEEQAGFMHLWNVIGHLSGLQEDLLPPTPKQAQILDGCISKRQFRASVHGTALTNSLISYITKIDTSKVSSSEILGLMRYLLGDDIADMLGMEAGEISKYKLGLIKTLNLFKGFKPAGNINSNYNQAYHQFKLQKPTEQVFA